MSDRYLVTGGAGFIGSSIARRLLSEGHEVVVLDNFSTGRRSNLYGIESDITLFEGDLRSYERVHNAVRGCDYVLHLGALPSVPRSVQDPLTSNDVNVNGTLNVVLAARDNGVRRVVVASSSSVYGANPAMPKTEDLQLLPISPYAVSKLATERYCLAAQSVYGLEAVAVRYFNVFGPRQDPASQYSAVIPKFIRLALAGKTPVIFGDGGQIRDFTYIDNVVDATTKAAVVPGAAGHAMNIACGHAVTLLDVVSAISGALGREIVPEFQEPRVGDVRESVACIDLAREVLGYEPSVEFAEGVKRTADYIRESETTA
ncbi:MAG: NAD-dependent epimerase/dehydratase family protein [Coriobacteriia bacterium]|nr:NAD-dependent epimerase/dehydratase family protein [Coriobacteriia bacterium]